MSEHRIFTTRVASVYPHYVTKAEKKGRTKNEVNRIICWLTGYSADELQQRLDSGCDFRTFFAEAPSMHPNTALITGVVCGVRVESVEDPLMQQIRWLDKLVDELAKGKAMEKILRGSAQLPPLLFAAALLALGAFGTALPAGAQRSPNVATASAARRPAMGPIPVMLQVSTPAYQHGSSGERCRPRERHASAGRRNPPSENS
jgi:hypothetical protein